MKHHINVCFDKKNMARNLVRILSQYDYYSHVVGGNREHPLFYKLIAEFYNQKDSLEIKGIREGKYGVKILNASFVEGLVSSFIDNSGFNEYYELIEKDRNKVVDEVNFEIEKYNIFEVIEDVFDIQFSLDVEVHPSPLLTNKDMPVFSIMDWSKDLMKIYLAPSRYVKPASFSSNVVRYTVAKEISTLYSSAVFNYTLDDVLNSEEKKLTLSEQGIIDFLKDNVVIGKSLKNFLGCLKGKEAFKESLLRASMMRCINPALNLVSEKKIKYFNFHDEKDTGYNLVKFFDASINYAKKNNESMETAIIVALKSIANDYSNNSENYFIDVSKDVSKKKISKEKDVFDSRNSKNLKYL